ncbi:MAG: chemotaxis protein CheA [Planctomycetes bacterium]|nr:chemotaxis protein CheA [Planctomycetota bacterium]
MSESISQSEGLLGDFVDESLESLRELPAQLQAYRANPENAEAVHSVFRSVHSIKGSASFFGLSAIKQFAHSVENTLDDIRNGKSSLGEDLARSLIEAFDDLDVMLNEALNGVTDKTLKDDYVQLLARIEQQANDYSSDVLQEQRLLEEVSSLADEMAAAGLPQSLDWSDRLRALVANRSDDDAFEEQAKVGEPDIDTFYGARFRYANDDVSERVYRLLELFRVTACGEYEEEHGRSFLEAAREFANWAETSEADWLIQPLNSAASDFQTIFSSPLDIDSDLLGIIWSTLARQLDKLRVCEPLPEETPTDTPEREAKANVQPTQTQTGETAPPRNRFLRVNEERVDTFLNDVSKLFITCERLKDLQARMDREMQLSELVDELRQINATFSGQTMALQSSVVALRKVPARGLFSKFPRVARTLATDLGKQLDVHLVGEENEIDKSLIEDLDSPLMHMVRNVCDHGIDTPESRRSRGVCDTGNLWLKCELTQTHVIITVQDDGRGIDPQRLREKVIDKGIMTAAQANSLSDDEAVDLIFHPGFSTAEQVSDVSGRGVGLDVVRTTIRDHSGDIKVHSQVDVGTTFRIAIPLRAAVVVVDGLLLAQDGDTFIVPFGNVGEIFELKASEISTVQGSLVARIRGEPFAAIRLGQALATSSRTTQGDGPTNAVMLTHKGKSICLLVDNVIGQRKVVINGLQDLLPNTTAFTGVAQLGGGRMALVLNPQEFVS